MSHGPSPLDLLKSRKQDPPKLVISPGVPWTFYLGPPQLLPWESHYPVIFQINTEGACLHFGTGPGWSSTLQHVSIICTKQTVMHLAIRVEAHVSVGLSFSRHICELGQSCPSGFPTEHGQKPTGEASHLDSLKPKENLAPCLFLIPCRTIYLSEQIQDVN